jgi:hypothetical protein
VEQLAVAKLSDALRAFADRGPRSAELGTLSVASNPLPVTGGSWREARRWTADRKGGPDGVFLPEPLVLARVHASEFFDSLSDSEKERRPFKPVGSAPSNPWGAPSNPWGRPFKPVGSAPSNPWGCG